MPEFGGFRCIRRPTFHNRATQLKNSARSSSHTPQALPTLLTRRNRSSSINGGRREPIIQFGSHPIGNRTVRMWPPLPTRSQWPSALRAARDDPRSKPRLHASSIRTRVAMRARPGHVFLSVVGDQGLAKAHFFALPLTSCQGECPASSHLFTRRIPAAKSALKNRNRRLRRRVGVQPQDAD